MWYYTIQGNSSQVLRSSKNEAHFYSTEEEALVAGGKVAANLTRVVGIALTVQASWKDGESLTAMESRFLTGLGARFGMTKSGCGNPVAQQ